MDDGGSMRDGLRPVTAPLAIGLALVAGIVVVDLFVAREALIPSVAVVAVALAALLVRERRRYDREHDARRRADVRADIGRLLEAPMDPEPMLARITELLVPALGDLALVDVLEDGATLRGTVMSAVDEEIAENLRVSRERYPLDPDGAHPVAVALRERTPQVVEHLDDERLRSYAHDEEHLALLRGAGYGSAMCLPLIARGRVLGVLSYMRVRDPRPYTDRDVSLGRDVAARAALALDNARLFQEVGGTERRLEAIIDNLGEAVAAYAPDGTIVFANPAAAVTVGARTEDELLGRPAHELLEDIVILDEDGRPLPPERRPLSRALAGGDPPPVVLHAVRRATGVDRWYVSRAVRVLDDAGATTLIVSVLEDITAIKREEARGRLLASASKLISSSLDVGATVERAAASTVPELADWARVDLVDERGVLREAAVAHRDPVKADLLREWRRRYPLDPEQPGTPYEALRTGTTVVWPEVRPQDVAFYARDEEHRALMERIDTRSALIVPLVAGERTIGTLQLATTGDSGRLLGDVDLELGEELARRMALAVENARLHATRTHIATTLQRSLLPPRLPVVPGMTIAARFRAAGPANEVGGDFYDLFAARGAWMIVMGDVTGKGPTAAATTSLARYTMRTAASYEDDPRAIVERLNTTLAEDPERRQICTAVCLALRTAPEGLRLDVTCAGHPPPLLVRGAGDVRALGSPGTLLGAFPDGAWTTESVALAPGDTVVLYTDGVTDVRGPHGRFGGERLEALLRRLGPASPDDVAGSIDDALLRFGEQRDDVALLVLQADAADAAVASAVAVPADDASS